MNFHLEIISHLDLLRVGINTCRQAQHIGNVGRTMANQSLGQHKIQCMNFFFFLNRAYVNFTVLDLAYII